jgi:hypothetical protein
VKNPMPYLSPCMGTHTLGPLYTRNKGWKNLGTTLSIFGLLFGPPSY